MAAFHIRPAEPADIAAVYGLVRGLAEYERLTHEMVASEADSGRFLRSKNRRQYGKRIKI